MHWAHAQAEQVGFMISVWAYHRGGPACGTCDVVEALGLKRYKKLQRSVKKWEKLLLNLEKSPNTKGNI